MRTRARSISVAACLLVTCWVPTTSDAIASVNQDDQIAKARAELREAVEEAHKGQIGRLSLIARSLRTDDSPYAASELQPDYLSLLEDRHGAVQLRGVQYLMWFKNVATRDAFCRYLKTRDFARLKAAIRGHPADANDDAWIALEYMAVSCAILGLGEIGDDSVVPLLNDLRDDVTWDAEWVGRPVEHALGKLGAVRVLARTPPDAEQRQIEAAAGAISAVRDPNRVLDLMEVAQDDEVQPCFRLAALSALGRFNSPDVSRLLLTIMNDPKASMDLRKEAATSAAQTGDNTAEAALLVCANDPKSPFRIHALVGLALGKPEKHLGTWFNTVLDVNEDLTFRKALFNKGQRISHLVFRNRKEDLYRCLHAAEKNGRPIDNIRVAAWYMICDFFREEPALVLTTKDPSVTASMKDILERRIIQSNLRVSFAEQRAMVDEKIDKLVTLYSENGSEARGPRP